MYTPSIIEKKFKNGMLSVAVKFDNSADSFTEWFSTKNVSNPSWLNDVVRNRTQEINECEAFTIPSTIDTSTPPAPVVTKEEREKRKWAKGLRTLNQMKTLVDMGVIPQDDAGYVSQRDLVKASYKSSYSELV